MGSIMENAGKFSPPSKFSETSVNKFTGVLDEKELGAHPQYPPNNELNMTKSEIEQQGKSLERLNNFCSWENRQYQNVNLF